jgi:lysophospholipase L1-like esterase
VLNLSKRGTNVIAKSKLMICVLAVLSGACATVTQADELLAPGDRMAICGDSITEQKNYSVVIEDYLLMCQPVANMQVSQFGWGGETTWGFAPRMAKDVLWTKPTVASVNYGMNDGGYGPVQAERIKNYRDKTHDIIQQFKSAGVRTIIITGPGAVDGDTYHHNKEAAVQYNQTLAAYGDAAKEVAASDGVIYADMHNTMAHAMEQFKSQHPGRSFVGNDGIHPENVGHMVMAYTILKALGCDGDIGTITVDLAGNKAEATAGHKVLSFAEGKVEIESARYPFCPGNDVKDALGQRAALSLIPFNEQLNRFKLVAKGGSAKRYRVTYGKENKVFDADRLASGINLNDEFIDSPFEETFRKVDNLIHAQQDFETLLTKQWIHNEAEWSREYPSAVDSFKQLAESGKVSDQSLRTAVSAAVVPVKYTITITPVE